MTDAEKAALEWLSNALTPPTVLSGYTRTEDHAHRKTIKRMLAQPHLPKEPSEEMLHAMDVSFHPSGQYARDISAGMYRALYEHLTKPATKMIDTWIVHWSWKGLPKVELHLSASSAEEHAKGLRNSHYGCEYRGIHVTGPHEQEVPA